MNSEVKKGFACRVAGGALLAENKGRHVSLNGAHESPVFSLHLYELAEGRGDQVGLAEYLPAALALEPNQDIVLSVNLVRFPLYVALRAQKLAGYYLYLVRLTKVPESQIEHVHQHLVNSPACGLLTVLPYLM